MLGVTTPEMAKHPAIKSTGLKGFLIWMQNDPVMSKVYAQIRPKIADALPNQSFADGRYTGDNLQGLGRMGDDSLTDFGVDLSAVQDLPQLNIDSTAAAAPTSGGSWVDTLSGLISGASQAVLAANQISTAKQVTAIQLQRAQAGQPPLDLNAYGVSATPGVNVGLSTSTEKLLMYGLLGLGVVILLPKLLGGRR